MTKLKAPPVYGELPILAHLYRSIAECKKNMKEDFGQNTWV